METSVWTSVYRCVAQRDATGIEKIGRVDQFRRKKEERRKALFKEVRMAAVEVTEPTDNMERRISEQVSRLARGHE